MADQQTNAARGHHHDEQDRHEGEKAAIKHHLARVKVGGKPFADGILNRHQQAGRDHAKGTLRTVGQALQREHPVHRRPCGGGKAINDRRQPAKPVATTANGCRGSNFRRMMSRCRAILVVRSDCRDSVAIECAIVTNEKFLFLRDMPASRQAVTLGDARDIVQTTDASTSRLKAYLMGRPKLGPVFS